MAISRKNSLISSLFLILLIIILLLLFFWNEEESQNPLHNPDAQLGIKDTASVYSIIIERYEGGKFIERRVIEKKDGKWYVDGMYPADPFRIKLLLETFYLIEPREKPNPKASENYRQFLKQTHFFVHVKIRGKPDLKYFVGSMTKDGIGTIMLKAGSFQPYVFHIPGFHGYLGSRYATPLPLWVDRTLFSAFPEELKRIQLKSSLKPNYQFELIRTKETPWRFQDGTPVNQKALANYLSHFGHIYADAVILTRAKEIIDSLSQIPPHYQFEIEKFDNQVVTLQMYVLPDSANYLTIRLPDKRLFKVQEYAFGQHFLVPKSQLMAN